MPRWSFCNKLEQYFNKKDIDDNVNYFYKNYIRCYRFYELLNKHETFSILVNNHEDEEIYFIFNHKLENNFMSEFLHNKPISLTKREKGYTNYQKPLKMIPGLLHLQISDTYKYKNIIQEETWFHSIICKTKDKYEIFSYLCLKNLETIFCLQVKQKNNIVPLFTGTINYLENTIDIEEYNAKVVNLMKRYLN